MSLLKSIVIGCDDTVTLSAILNNIHEVPGFLFNVISAGRSSDLMSIVKSLDPDLVILGFRNNQLVLDDFDVLHRKPEMPMLCITPRSEGGKLRWPRGRVVFTCSAEHVASEDYLTSRVHSIFLLGSSAGKPARHSDTGSLAAAAMAQHNSMSETKNLSRYVMELDQKVEVLLKVKERISELFPRVDDPTRQELMSIANTIKASANDNKLWEDFKVYFESSNPGFLKVLASKHPELTQMDLKYCCYLKMNMSNDDIRNLLGINQESVRTHKYRLKKKMDLAKEQDLTAYLRSLENQGAAAAQRRSAERRPPYFS